MRLMPSLRIGTLKSMGRGRVFLVILTSKREVPHSNGSPLSAGMKAYRTSGFDAHLFCSDICRSAKP